MCCVYPTRLTVCAAAVAAGGSPALSAISPTSSALGTMFRDADATAVAASGAPVATAWPSSYPAQTWTHIEHAQL